MTEQNLTQSSVSFWRDEHILQWEHDIPFIVNLNKNYFGKNWSEKLRTFDDVRSQLASARRCWFRLDDKQDRQQIRCLVGNYALVFNVITTSDYPKLWLAPGYGINYATNMDRVQMLKHGVQVEHQGLVALTPQEMGSRENQSDFWKKKFVDAFRSVIRGNTSLKPGSGGGNAPAISDQQSHLLDAVQAFIDAEFELEELQAQETPPFAFHSLKAVSRRTVYRQFFEATLQEDDFRRFQEVKPSMLVLKDPMGLPENDVRFEVAGDPDPEALKIFLSMESQVQQHQIPEEGELLIGAMPTLKKVRSEVLEKLHDGDAANDWVLRVLADEYQVPSFRSVSVSLPPSKFPPTPSQRKAIDMGAAVPDYCLTLGPPGTGKTTVILSWVNHFVRAGKRVLVTSQNNKAVDNVLERLAEESEFECLRIGNETKISSALEPIMLDNKARELQAKLFVNGDAALDYFSKAMAFVDHLLEHRDEVRRIQSSYSVKRAELGAAVDRHKQLRVRLVELRDGYEKAVQELKQIESTLTDLGQRKNSGFWGFLKNPATHFRVRRLTAQRATQAERVSDGYRVVTERESELSGLVSAIQQLEPEVRELKQSLDSFFQDRPLPYVDDIDLPESGSFEGAAAEDIQRSLQNIREHLAGWYEKLRGERQQALYQMLMENVNVVGATCIGINTKALFRDMDFDVVIVDEAGQIQVHNLIVPLSRAGKVILVGDHKQLPPVVKDEVLEEIEFRGFQDEEDLYRLSWFERLWEQSPDNRKVMLDTQFRCPKEISDFVSNAFYGGAYYAGAGMESKRAIFEFCPGPMVFVNTQYVPKHFEQSRSEGSRSVVLDNAVETQVVIEILKRAVKASPELARNREIGVIVPYANHVKAIQQAIRKERSKGRLKELDMPLHELVASVDSFQGQERDLIIFPFTRSNNRGAVGFLADWRRLNVAQTRAKKQLIMVGDMKTLTTPPKYEDARDVEFKQAMQQLNTLCEKQGWLLNARELLPQRPQEKPSRKIDGGGFNKPRVREDVAK